jgi:N-acetylglutamate synthase-like GNAT family acetyltransferase
VLVLLSAVLAPFYLLQRAVGVVNVTLMQASDSISAVASCNPGTPFAMVTNMAVTPAMRRRGIAHQLMQVRFPARVVWVVGSG